MKKQLKNIRGLFAFVLLLSVVTGCKFWAETSGGNKGADGKTTANSDSKKTSERDEKPAKSGLAKDIIGTWNGNPDREEEITMTFKDDGSISIITDDGEEKSTVDAKYRVVDEKTVEITFDDGKTSKITDVKISGDSMDAKGKNSRPATFKRVG